MSASGRGILRLLVRSARRRLGDSALLALSTMLSVTAVAVFAAAGGAAGFTEVLRSRETVRGLFRAALAVLVLFAGMSGWSFAEHYMKRRKREIGSWLLLGMRRSGAVAAVSAEFLFASVCAFAAGIVLAALFARFFALLLAALMRERTPLSLALGPDSLAAAAAACLFQWLAASARAVSVVSSSSLAGLMRSEREAEEPARLRPLRSLLGILLVAAGYGGAVVPRGEAAENLMLPVLAAVVAGTFLSFDAVVPALANRLRGRRLRAAAEALVARAQISFRSRRNARLLALAAVLTATAATALGSVIALDMRDDAVARRVCPHDVELSPYDPGTAAAVEEALTAAGAQSARRLVVEWIPAEVAAANGRPREARVFSLSACRSVLAELGEKPEPVEEGRVRVWFPRSYVAGYAFGGAEADERIVLRSGPASRTLLSYDGELLPLLSSLGGGLPAVVSDADWRALREGGAAVSRSALWNGIADAALRSASRALAAEGTAGLYARTAVLDEQAGVYGIMLFIGAFLAAVFITAAASLLAFRCIEDARDDADRYRILAEIGASHAVLRRSLALQNAFAFGLPLGFGLCHTAAALVMMRNITDLSNAGPTAFVSLASILVFILFALLATDRQAAGLREDTARGRRE